MVAPGGLNRSMHVVSDYEASALQNCRDLRIYLFRSHTPGTIETGTPPCLGAELIYLFA